MEKIKLNPRFKPLTVDDNDELFANGIFEFNISRLITFINANPGKFPLEKVEAQSLHNFNSKNLNEFTINTANLSAPLILAEISPGMFNVIDGHHRLEKAHQSGLEMIPVYRVYAEQHLAFLTSARAYNAYIEYWNGKVAERCS